MTLAFYGRFAKFLQKLFLFYKREWKVEFKTPIEGPVVYLVHHQNLFGPIHSLCLLPQEVHIWSLNVFLDKDKCFDQFYNYTLTVRNKWAKAPAYVVAKILSGLIPKVLNSFKAIPVYRNASYLVTIRKTMEVFKKDESILLCPDTDYTSKNAEIGDLYMGFLVVQKVYEERIQKVYQDKQDKSLPFVPIYCSKKQKKMIVGEPIYADTTNFPENQEQTLQTLRNGINQLGYECGDISKEVYEKGLE